MDSEIKETKKKSNNNLIKIIIAVVLIIGAAIAVFFAIKSFGDNQSKIEKELTKIGGKFYSEFYYEQIAKGKETAQVSEFLVNYKDIGIKINLDNLERYNNGEFKDTIATFKNDKTDKACNKATTMVIIYPKEPYEKNDFTTKAELDCGFETKK